VFKESIKEEVANMDVRILMRHNTGVGKEITLDFTLKQIK